FAVFGGNQFGQFLLASVEQLPVAKQNLRAFRQKSIAPSRKSCLGSCDSFVDGGLTAHSNLPGHSSGGWIGHVTSFDRGLRAFGVGVINPVVNQVHVLRLDQRCCSTLNYARDLRHNIVTMCKGLVVTGLHCDHDTGRGWSGIGAGYLPVLTASAGFGACSECRRPTGSLDAYPRNCPTRGPLTRRGVHSHHRDLFGGPTTGPRACGKSVPGYH